MPEPRIAVPPFIAPVGRRAFLRGAAATAAGGAALHLPVATNVWQDFQLSKQRDAVSEWNLPTEPFTFFVAGAGAVVGKLEAVFREELKSGLDQVVAL